MRCRQRRRRAAVAATDVETKGRMLLVHRTGRFVLAARAARRRDGPAAGRHAAEDRAAREEQTHDGGLEMTHQHARRIVSGTLHRRSRLAAQMTLAAKPRMVFVRGETAPPFSPSELSQNLWTQSS